MQRVKAFLAAHRVLKIIYLDKSEVEMTDKLETELPTVEDQDNDLDTSAVVVDEIVKEDNLP